MSTDMTKLLFELNFHEMQLIPEKLSLYLLYVGFIWTISLNFPDNFLILKTWAFKGSIAHVLT